MNVLNNKSINLALSNIKQRKAINEKEFEMKLSQAKKSSPTISSIELELMQIGSQIAMSTISGNFECLEALKNKSMLLSSQKADLLKSLGVDDKPNYTCKKCNDTGFVNDGLCSCVYNELKRLSFCELFSDVGIKALTFDNFDLSYYPDDVYFDGYYPRKVMNTTLNIAKEFVKSFPNGKNLLFVGNTGLGKTHLSIAIAAEITAKGYDVIYGSSQNILSKAVREEMDWSSNNEYVNRLLNCDLLVFDDLGTELDSKHGSAMLYNIINTRIQKQKSTIINTNLSDQEIETKYDPRIASRLIGNYTARYFLGNDIRQIKAGQ